MILGVLVLPNSADANFLSNLLNRQASAKEEILDTTNSQNIGLLEANVSSLALLNKNTTSKEDVALNITNDALLPVVGPLTPSGESEEDSSFSYQEISIYVVRQGDNINDIAKMFNVSVNTILWANDMKKGDKLKTGDTLIILPVDGVKHVIKKGDTVKNMAKSYGVETRDIYEFNSLDEKSLLSIGDEIIIPGAEIKEQPKPVVVAKKPATSKPSGKTNLNLNIQGGVIPNNYRIADNSTPIPGYFIKPVTGGSCRLTQGKHDRYAIDIGCPTGTPIYASASGKVIFSKVGWNGAFGNLVIIAHPNGTQTFYAHQSKIAVSIGDQVSQGEVIGYVGNTGRSTGPHIHFEVRGAKNPGFDNSWAK